VSALLEETNTSAWINRHHADGSLAQEVISVEECESDNGQ